MGGACDPERQGCNLGQEYEYDIENRLVRIRRDSDNQPDFPGEPGGKVPEPNILLEFVYDALGRRVETIEYVDAATGQVRDGQNGNPAPRRIRHVYFGLELIQEYACADNWPCGSALPLAREFLWGDPERYPEPVAMIRHRFDPVVIETYHYLHDVLGSVVGLVNDAGTLVERYTYDPYGKPLIEKWDAQTSTWQASAEPASGLPYSPTGNPFLWTGHRYDPAVGLYHTLYRTYSPTVGRWLQRDPIEYGGGSINLYEYVASSPLSLVDPMRLETRVNDGPIGPPPNDYKQDKCRAAANKALSNCLKAVKSGCAGAPSKDDCFKTFSQSMDACARNKPGTHEETEFLESDWLDCFSGCVEKGTQLCLGVGVVGEAGLQIPGPKTVNPPYDGVTRERIISKLLGAGAGSQRTTAFLQVTRTPGFLTALIAGNCVALAEAACAAACIGG